MAKRKSTKTHNAVGDIAGEHRRKLNDRRNAARREKRRLAKPAFFPPEQFLGDVVAGMTDAERKIAQDRINRMGRSPVESPTTGPVVRALSDIINGADDDDDPVEAMLRRNRNPTTIESAEEMLAHALDQDERRLSRDYINRLEQKIGAMISEPEKTLRGIQFAGTWGDDTLRSEAQAFNDPSVIGFSGTWHEDSEQEVFRSFVREVYDDTLRSEAKIVEDEFKQRRKFANILHEANNIVTDRHERYGTPVRNLGKVAGLWTEYLGLERNLCAADVANMMILIKIAREKSRHGHDNIVDMIGYALCLDEITS